MSDVNGARLAIRTARKKMSNYKPTPIKETSSLLQRKKPEANEQDDSFYEDLILRIRKTNENA